MFPDVLILFNPHPLCSSRNAGWSPQRFNHSGVPLSVSRFAVQVRRLALRCGGLCSPSLLLQGPLYLPCRLLIVFCKGWMVSSPTSCWVVSSAGEYKFILLFPHLFPSPVVLQPLPSSSGVFLSVLPSSPRWLPPCILWLASFRRPLMCPLLRLRILRLSPGTLLPFGITGTFPSSAVLCCSLRLWYPSGLFSPSFSRPASLASRGPLPLVRLPCSASPSPSLAFALPYSLFL